MVSETVPPDPAVPPMCPGQVGRLVEAWHRRVGSASMSESHQHLSEVPVFPFGSAPGLDFPEYAKLRRADPVSLVRLVTGGHPYLVTRYADVRPALTDPVFSRAGPARPKVAVLVPGARIPHMMTN